MIRYLKQFLTRRSDNERTVIRNSAWLFVAEIGTRIARGGLAIVAARMLGANGLGQFSYAMALGGFLTFFEDAGIGMFVTREFVHNDQESVSRKQSIFSTALILKTILLGVAILLFLCIGPIASSIPSANVLIPIMALVLIFDSLREFFFSISRAEQNMYVESRVKLLTNGLVVVLGIILMAISPTALSLAWGYAIGGGIGCLLIFLSVRKYIPSLRKSFSRELFSNIFKAAWPFTVLAISNVIIFNTDTLFLGHYASVTEVGWYSAATKLIQALYILPSLFASAAFPVFVRKTGGTTNGFMPALKKSLLLMTAVMVPILLVTTIGSRLIIYTLFGASYAPAAIILAVFSLSYIPVFIGTTLNTAVFAMNRQRQFVIANILGMVLNAAMNYLLIPRLHAVGAALSTVVSLSLITIVTFVKIRKLTSVKIDDIK